MFNGRLANVLGKIERFEEHEDFVRAHAEHAQTRETHVKIDRLLARLRGAASESYRYYALNQKFSESDHHRALRNLRKSNE